MFASLLLSAALAGSPAQPQTEAYTGLDPIQIAACAITTPVDVPAVFGIDTPNAGSVSISFVNQNSKPVSSVAFNVTNGRTTSRIVDAGTFSDGAVISHRFSAPAFTNALGDVTCSVQSVAFADGSTWEAQ
jgi:hypothetical protein